MKNNINRRNRPTQDYTKNCINRTIKRAFRADKRALKTSISRYEDTEVAYLVKPTYSETSYPPIDLVRFLLLDLPCTWNNIPEYLRDPKLSIDNFRRLLKIFLFAQY